MGVKINSINTETTVEVSVEQAWKIWTNADDIKQWNIPFADWHCPVVENDVRKGGAFLFRMATMDLTMQELMISFKTLQSRT